MMAVMKIEMAHLWPTKVVNAMQSSRALVKTKA
jgi:hypothetical protein